MREIASGIDNGNRCVVERLDRLAAKYAGSDFAGRISLVDLNFHSVDRIIEIAREIHPFNY